MFDIGNDHDYFNANGDDNLNNLRVLEKVVRKSYLPTNALLLELLKRYPQFRASFSFSGILLEQFERYFPQALRSFQALVHTGRVEVLSETYYHSLSFLHSKPEFKRQVRLHGEKIQTLFHQKPRVFRNTELIYNNELAK